MRIAIFTGSSAGTSRHRSVAAEFATALAKSGTGIVYGGAHVGLMGVVADSALAVGGEVIGVIPQQLVDWEVAHTNLTRLDVVDTMHERKARMTELADAFVALPGGVGTVEELFEVYTWGQLGLHAKPSAVLDLDDFYRPILDQLGRMVHDGYLHPSYRASLGVVHNAGELLEFVARYRHPEPKSKHLDSGPRR